MAEYKFDSSYRFASVLLCPIFCLYSPFCVYIGMFSFHESRFSLAISLQLALPWCFVFQSLLVTFWIRLEQHHLEQKSFMVSHSPRNKGPRKRTVIALREDHLSASPNQKYQISFKHHQNIKYNQISNEHKPPWHHPASCGTSCQRCADSSWGGSLKASADPDRSVGYLTACGVCSWAQQCATGKKMIQIQYNQLQYASKNVMHDAMSPTKESCLSLQTFALHPRHTTSLTRSWCEPWATAQAEERNFCLQWQSVPPRVLFDSLNTVDTAPLSVQKCRTLEGWSLPALNPHKSQQANTNFVLWPNPFFRVFSQPKEPS